MGSIKKAGATNWMSIIGLRVRGSGLKRGVSRDTYHKQQHQKSISQDCPTGTYRSSGLGFPWKPGLLGFWTKGSLHFDRPLNAVTGWLKIQNYTVEALRGFAASRDKCCIKELVRKLCEETPQSPGIQKSQVQLFLLFSSAEAARLHNPDGNRDAFLFNSGRFTRWTRHLFSPWSTRTV